METDYYIKIQQSSQKPRQSCETCRNNSVCQYYIEIFDGRWSNNTIANKRLINFIAEVCRHYENKEI
jgi:hypothetical protein